MAVNIYESLRRHFNGGSPIQLRESSEILEILEILFKPDDVEYALALPLNVQGRLSLEEVAGKMKKDSKEVEEKLESMAREAKVMVNRSRRDGKKYYSLWTLTVGILENTFADGIDNDQRRQLSRLWRKYYEEVFVDELASSKYPFLRVVPINRKIDAASRVLPFEEISTLIEKAEVIAVIPCFCRQVMKRCNHIMDAEIVLGAYADFMISYRGAKRITREEALRKLRECEQDGLVHLTGNAQEGSAVICNCCPCCCDALRGMIELHKHGILERSNFEPNIGQDECTLCLKCEEICPAKAISGNGGPEANAPNAGIRVDTSLCIGCGLCAYHCPTEAISMVKVRDVLPVRSLKESTDRYVKEKGV